MGEVVQNLEEAFSSLIAAAAATCNSSPLALHIAALHIITAQVSSLINAAATCNSGATASPLALHCALGAPLYIITLILEYS